MFTKSSVSQALIDTTKSIMEASDKKLLLEPSKKMPERLQGDIAKKMDDKAAATGNTAEVRESDEKDSPFNWRGKASELPKKPGESAGFNSKKISTGTVYSKKYKKDKEEIKEEHEDAKEDAIEDKKIIKAMVKKSALKDDESKESKKDNEKKEMSEATENFEAGKITHIVAKSDLEKHKEGMDSEGYDTHTKPLPKTHPKYATHVGIVSKKPSESGYHEDFYASPIKEVKEEVEQMDERHMTASEKETREHNVKSMKKGLAGFKARYGNRAKNVMYATATKQAMKEEDELAEALKGKQTKLDKNHNGKLDAQDFKILRKEDIGGISTMSEKKKEVKEAQDVRIEPNEDMQTKTVDTLSGRKKVGADYHNQTKSYKLKLNVESSPAKEGQIAAGGGTPAEQGAMAAKYEKKKEIKEGKGTDVDPNFVTNESTPLKMAKDLAKKSFKKIRNEMLGTASATSEEKKKW